LALPLPMTDKLLALTVRTTGRPSFRPDGEPDGPLLVFGAHVAIGLGDPEGVVEQALRQAPISPGLASGLKSVRSEGPPLGGPREETSAKEVGVGASGLGLNRDSRATPSACGQNRLLVMIRVLGVRVAVTE
jgi:hypothetical protein